MGSPVRQFVIGMGIIVLAIPVLWLLGMVGLGIYISYNMCVTTVHSTTPSPDGKVAVVVYDINCGATTRFNRQVAFSAAGRKFDPEDATQIWNSYGNFDIGIKWLQPDAVELAIPNLNQILANERIFLKADIVGDRKILYRSVPE